MTPSSVKKALSKTWKTGLAIMLHGQPGVGKSQVVHQVAKDMGYKVVDVRLSQLDPVDLRGIPFVDKDNNITRWIPPEFLPREPKVCLFLDEINSAPQGTQAAAYQLILDRKLGNYSLPEDCVVIAAGNRLQDRAIVQQMSSALKNRLVHIDYDADLDDWCAWALTSNIAIEVLSFIRFRPGLLNEFDAKANAHKSSKDTGKSAKDIKAFATPRSWEFVSRMLNAGLSLKDDEFQDLVAGTVGEGPAAEFFAHMKYYSKLPDIDAILLNPTNFVSPKEPQLKYAIATALAARANKDNMDTLLLVTEKLDEEFQVLVAKDIVGRDASLSCTPAFKKWGVKNAKLIV